jgi:hypothetical protein
MGKRKQRASQPQRQKNLERTTKNATRSLLTQQPGQTNQKNPFAEGQRVALCRGVWYNSTMRFLRIRPIRLDLGDVLVQIVAVFLGVICAFAVNSWQTHNAERALLRATLRSIVVELESNRDSLRVVKVRHAIALRALTALVHNARASSFVSGSELLKTLRDRGKFGINVPLDIAWQIAQNNQGLTLLSYDDRYTLAEVYQVQAAFSESERRYGNSFLSIPQSPTNNYYVEAVDLADQAYVVVLAENQLDDLYTDALRKIR